jgi:hypothetical protein
MSNFLLIFLLSLSLVQAGLPPTRSAGQDQTLGTAFNIRTPFSQVTNLGGINKLIETGNNSVIENGSFEHSTPSTGWTVSNGSIISDSGTIFGSQAGEWDPAAAAHTLNQDYTTSSEWSGVPALASCYVKTTRSDVKFRYRTNGTASTGDQLNVSSAGTWNRYQIQLTSTTTSIGLEVASTTASTGIIYIDNCELAALSPSDTVSAGKPVKSANVADGSSTTTVTEDNENLINGNCTNGDNGNYICTFQTAYASAPHCWVESRNSELSVRVTTSTTAANMQFRAPVGSWTGFTLSHTWSANTTDTAYMRQVGESLEIKAQIDINSAPTGGLTVTLPSSLVADTPALQDPELGSAGTWSYHDNGTGRRLGGAAELLSTTTVRFNTNTNVTLDATNPVTWASGDQIGILLDIPVTAYTFVGVGTDTDFFLFCKEQ